MISPTSYVRVVVLLAALASSRECFAAWVPPPPVPLEKEAPWRVVSLAKDAGVQRRMVFDVSFQADGLVWFAVSDGLYRYDGYRWEHFTATNGLPSSFIRTVKVIRDGTLWVGTDRGAGVFDGKGFDRQGTEGRLAGPNVRRVAETRDGALWFCCDRWPDSASSGGLTRLKSGEFRTFTVADGLPSDHVMDLFQQSSGRIIALTMAGPAVLEGEHWSALTDPGYPANDHTWAMEEAPDGTLVAQGWTSTLMYQDGVWRACSEDSGSLCVTRDGAVIRSPQTRAGQLAFFRWDGVGFVRASAEVTDQGLSTHVVRQAPDGSIWAVGRGTIVRWEYLPGRWSWYPEFKGPLIEDRQHRLWFAMESGGVFREGDPSGTNPGMRPPLVEDGHGVIWGGSEGGLAAWKDGEVERVPAARCGLASVEEGLVDGQGTAWMHGTNGAGAQVVAALIRDTWQSFVLTPDARKTVSMGADPGAGIWAVLSDGISFEYEVLRVTPEGVRVVDLGPSKPRTHLPKVCISQSRFHLYAFNGLWESPLKEPLLLQQVTEGAGRVFTRGASISSASAFLGQEGIDGQAAILLRRNDGWRQQRLSHGDALGFGKDGFLMVADGGEMALWQAHQWNSATYVGLPIDTTIQSLLRSHDGRYWFGTAVGVLNLQPDSSPPGTLLSGHMSAAEGKFLDVKATGLAPFAPRSRSTRYQFAWRIDGGEWSGYDDWAPQGISVAGLLPGRHVLQARARDGLGIEDPNPATFPFEVVPIPIQDRRWFRPVLVGVGLALAGLSLALYGVTRRLRRHSERLEGEVQARTAELRRDLERREQLEETLRQSEKRFRAMVEQGSDAITLVGPRTQILYEGPTVARLTGYSSEERIGKSALEFVHPEDIPSIRLILEDLIARPGSMATAQFRAHRKDGSLWWVEGTATNLLAEPAMGAIVVNFRDITERKLAEVERSRLQEQLSQARKMESVGRLAGGVAHDFNNMLHVILGNISLALEEPGISPQLQEHLLEAQKAADRSADLTRQLLAFARRQTVSPRVLDLNNAIGGMLKMLRRLIGEDVQLVWKPGANLWPIRLDPSQLDQILANLAVNGRDAIRGVGVLTIQTTNVTLAPENAEGLADFLPGDYALLEVTDNGCGMDRATQSHLFEPFFTTKSVGEGTGLGLATVYGIVKQNGGLIGFQSERGTGTTFRLYLPKVEAPTPSDAPAAGPKSLRGRETILLVEDEPTVLKLGQRVLEGLGYKVLIATQPADAEQIALEYCEPIDLLLTDLIMPGMNGRDLSKLLHVRRPGLRCLYMSGYTADAIARQGMLENGVHFLQKPFTKQNLATKVREVLDADLVVSS